jgi:predicted transcriptional regulator
MKRSKEDIAMTILEVCKKPVSKTRIVYLGNLNFRTIKPYIDQLTEAGLLEISVNSEIITYKTTPKGLETLEHFKGIRDSTTLINK